MSKYKVGDELIFIHDPSKVCAKLQSMTKLIYDGEYANMSLAIRVEKVEYDKPNVTLTYKTIDGDIQKVFAVCRDIDNFNEEMVLEKALLKAFQNELINLAVGKNAPLTIKK